MTVRLAVWGAAAVLAAASSGAAWSAETTVTAEMMPLADSRSLMLDITDAASRGVIVGERGHILVSESRSDWRQVEGVPTRATLTAVTAVGDKVWAVGHDGLILHSADGGLTWSVQRVDRVVSDPDEMMSEEFNPQAGAPLLDVMFDDERNGFAIGAFSLLLRTEDGGATWTKHDVTPEAAEADDAAVTEEGADDWTFDADELTLEEEENPHLNGITRTASGLLMIVGERGSAFRSRDNGASWERLQLPYAGSMFGVLALGPERLLAYGLRGHILESTDGGNEWQQLDTGVELSLMGGAALPDGGFVVVGANGVVIHRDNASAALQVSTYTNESSETPVLASVLPLGTRTFLVCGDKGMGRYQAQP